MGFFFIFLIIVGFFYIFSKSTSYGPKGFMGGYSETQMGNDMYAVKFQGNGNTRPDKSVDFCMLRSADLTLEKGYKFFSIVESRTGNQGYTPSGTYGPISSHPASNMTIKMLHEKTANEAAAYDAAVIAQSYREKYKINK